MAFNESVYNLKLADGQKWQFAASPDAVVWMGKFASIMKLEKGGTDCPRKLFFSREVQKPGWKRRDFGGLKIYSHNRSPVIYFSLGEEETPELDIVRMWNSLNPIYEKTINAGGLPFHSAFVERGGKGVLLAASGDTGKSTCFKRIPPPWRGVCDDEALVVRAGKGRYRVHPFPTWSNYLYERDEVNWSAEQSFPLSAVFFLQQSETDYVEPIGTGRAAMMINDSASQICRRMLRRSSPEEEKAVRNKVFENGCLIAKTVPSYILNFSLEGRFWEEIVKVFPHAA